MRRIVFTTLALLALALPAAVHAQDDSTTERRPARTRDRDGDCRCGLREVRDDDGGPSRRRGLWFSAGLGAGSESFDANDGLGWSDDQGGGMVNLGSPTSDRVPSNVLKIASAMDRNGNTTYYEYDQNTTVGYQKVNGHTAEHPIKRIWMPDGEATVSNSR